MLKKSVTLITFCLCLVACGPSDYLAPVRNAFVQPQQSSGIHVVRRHETLYAIAWRYDMDYRTLARLNHLSPPYDLNVGQQIRFKSSAPATRSPPLVRHSKKLKKNVSKTPKRVSKQYRKRYRGPVKRWLWPVQGKITRGFAPKKGAKGIDIGGQVGQTVRAAAAGRVAYSGSGIRGYGNLLIIKHNDDYLSAYAYNKTLLVKEGQWVKAGQKVALMGQSRNRIAALHFEIRRAGRPVNPLRYLKRRS